MIFAFAAGEEEEEPALLESMKMETSPEEEVLVRMLWFWG